MKRQMSPNVGLPITNRRLVIAIFLSTNAYDDNHENTYDQSVISKSKNQFY